jgi:hypothetical protein
MKNFLSNNNIRKARVVLSFLISAIFSLAIASAVATGGDATTVGDANVLSNVVQISALITALAFSVSIASRFKFSERRAFRFLEPNVAFMGCVAIDADITIPCPNDLTSGVVANFLIANKDDISSIVYSGTNAHLITDINMKQGKKFFKVEGQLQSTEPKVTMIAGTYVNQFEHELKFLVFKIDAATRTQLAKMKDGNFVAIIENNFTSSDSSTKYEVFGAGSGLKGNAIERTSNDTETLGAFSVTLKTAEYAREAKLPCLLFDTNAANTETLVASLLVAAP